MIDRQCLKNLISYIGDTMILGYGLSGKSAAKLISYANLDCNLYICDKKISSIPDNDRNWLSGEKIALLDESEGQSIIQQNKIKTLIVSPGVPLNNSLIKLSSLKNINILGELEFASELLSGKLIGITGTNGKTTTVHLLNEILNNGGKTAKMSGNMGVAVSEAALNFYDAEFHVIEISSFQLDLSSRLSLEGAILTNVSPDHCDRYLNMDEYTKSKMIIESRLKKEGFFILRHEDVRDFKKIARITEFKTNWHPIGSKDTEGVNFYSDNNGLWFSEGGGWRLVIESCKIHLRGGHMLANAAMAAQAAYICGISLDCIVDTINNFKGLPHRVEFVGEKNNIKFYNDSKATNLDATLKALDTFLSPVVIILGGRDKGADLSLLKEKISQKARAVVLIGETSDYYAGFFKGSSKIVRSTDMMDAVAKCYAEAKEGDVVLLSPACASFDMYKNFEERGDCFKQAVLNILNK